MDAVFPSGATPPGYRVYRAEVEPQQETSAAEHPAANLKSPLELLGSVSSHEYQDKQFEFGKTYLYTVRAVAQYGQDFVESADSPPANVTPRDTFHPRRCGPGGRGAPCNPETLLTSNCRGN